MDITSLYNISSGAVKEAAGQQIAGSNVTRTPESESFGYFLKLAMGETDNTHDLTIALGKASTALSYTVAVRDKILEAYKELMQIQI